MHKNKLVHILFFVLATLFCSDTIQMHAAQKRPPHRIRKSSSAKPSREVQRRLAIERARIRDSIRKEFYQRSKKPAKKSPSRPVTRKSTQPKRPPKKVQKRAPAKKSPTKKAPAKKAPPKRKKSPPKKPRRTKRKRSRTYSSSTPTPKVKGLSPQERLRELRRTVDKLVREADKKASVGVKVVLLKNNSTVYEKNANELFKPASNTKLITAAAAFHILGPQYRFKTTLFTDRKVGAHAINNLYIRGSGDPTLTDKDLATLARRLRSQGISEIKGDIIVDASRFNMQGTGPGWRTGDGAIYDKAPTGALMVNHSCIRVRVKPSRVVGKRPIVTLYPHTPYSRIQNNAQTRAKTKGRSIHVLRGVNNKIIVRGSVSKKSASKFYRIAVEHPHRYAGQVLAAVLKKNKLFFTGKVKTGRVPKSAKFLAEHTSNKLSTIIRYMMKASDNLYADAIFRAMGAQMYGAPGTWTKGKLAVNSFLKNTVGMNTSTIIIKDGSGLSHKNKVSPNHFIKLLTWVYTKSPHKESFIASLPIGGVDGTLRNRMKHRSTKAAVKAKTGSLSGVTSLSGYITPKTGLPLIFVIMVNRTHKSAVIFKRKLEDQLCKLLAAHAFSTS